MSTLLKYSVQHGAVLGPLLLLYVNDIQCAIECDYIVLFADDFFLMASDKGICVVR